MALEDDVFKVPESIPPFSKHTRHFSRISEEWPFASFTDDFYDDLPYCCTAQEKPLHKGSLAPLRDFNELRLRNLSTSTPFQTRDSISQFQDSGFTEYDVSTTFSSSCTLNSTQDSGRYSMCSDLSDADQVYSSLPLPRLSLESAFDSCAKSTDTDSAYESAYSSQDTISDCNSQTDLNLASKIEELKSSQSPDLFPGDNFFNILKKYTPTEPDRLIGRRIGRQQVDIVGELQVRNMSSVLKCILDNVEDIDLSSMRCVNKQWKQACDNDRSSSNRRAQALEKQRLRRLVLQQVCILSVHFSIKTSILCDNNVLSFWQFWCTIW